MTLSVVKTLRNRKSTSVMDTKVIRIVEAVLVSALATFLTAAAMVGIGLGDGVFGGGPDDKKLIKILSKCIPDSIKVRLADSAV